MSEVRDGYNDPAMATTQAEKYGAWVRGQEEARARERATPASPARPPEISDPIHFNPVSHTESTSTPVPIAPSTAGGTAQAVAFLFAVIALVCGYAPQVSAGKLGIYVAIGAILGYAVGWLVHWAIVITGVILKVAIKIAVWGFVAYIVLVILGKVG
ncbi:MAG: hypothetical protein JWR65_676 [Massilia sp.]|jgi:hypothetical protein|nr:hypothetical protein [Massilia sp.]